MKDTEDKHIEGKEWQVKVESGLNKPWENTTADAPFEMPDTSPDISGTWKDTDDKVTHYDAQNIHIHYTDPGYSASALVTMFGVGVLLGASLLALLWTHLPWG